MELNFLLKNSVALSENKMLGARPKSFAEKLEEGTINFNAVFGKLKEVGYNDYLSIEYVHQNYMMTVYDDVLSETIKMRDLYNTWKGS